MRHYRNSMSFAGDRVLVVGMVARFVCSFFSVGLCIVNTQALIHTNCQRCIYMTIFYSVHYQRNYMIHHELQSKRECRIEVYEYEAH